MQLGAVLVFDAGPLQLRHGGVDVERLRAYTAKRLSGLPRPGDERALKRFAARVFSQELDPEKPLWELWIVEGLEAARFALLAKCDAALLEPSARTSGTLARAGEEVVRRVASLARPSGLLEGAASAVRFVLDFAEGALAGAHAP